IALTLETLVSLLYWPISFYDPSLMIPPPPAVPPPILLDIALHLFPTLFLWIDYLCFSPTLDTTYANIILVGFALVYTAWIELAATYRNSNKCEFFNPVDIIHATFQREKNTPALSVRNTDSSEQKKKFLTHSSPSPVDRLGI
ncbi:hypothetical protein CROQUDRAFT_36610, partial [Cronartium quercuum f. sp. fusiforme G11]